MEVKKIKEPVLGSRLSLKFVQARQNIQDESKISSLFLKATMRYVFIYS